MADDCEVGGISVEEARQAVVGYFQTNYSLSYDVFYPGESEPDLESRDNAFILLGIDGMSKEQAGMGMREFITDKFLDISFWIRDGAGMKEISVFEDFVDGLAIQTSGGVVYGTPVPLSEKDFKGWVVNTILLPFKF
jgi:hypothetical protein